jgi:DNA uptake protein ComE-like DNA-binding protein
MHVLRKWIRYLFGFSRRETNGFLILMPLLLVILFSQPVFEMIRPERPRDFSHERDVLDSLVALLEKGTSQSSDSLATEALFPFNPNTATQNELRMLGFSEEIVKRILNYRAKGGRFNVKSDLLKIYGMDTLSFKKTYDFNQLPEARNWVSLAHTQRPKKLTPPQRDSLFDINTVDSATLIRINGIGPVLSGRIVRYREKLGGFISKSQLNEVYGLDSTVVHRLAATCFINAEFEVRKLNINILDEVALSAHPYLSRSEAKAIVAYRFQHGNYPTIQDIRKIHSIEEKTIRKIEPYLTTE